jgi:hypothetical protein
MSFFVSRSFAITFFLGLPFPSAGRGERG